MKPKFKIGDKVYAPVTESNAVWIVKKYSPMNCSLVYLIQNENSGEETWVWDEQLERVATSQEYYDSHYKEAIVEPILIMQKFFSPDEFKGFLKGNILKYRMRVGLKEDNEDKELAKIKRYQQWLHEFEEKGEITV